MSCGLKEAASQQKGGIKDFTDPGPIIIQTRLKGKFAEYSTLHAFFGKPHGAMAMSEQTC